MKITENLFVNVTFGMFILFMIYFYHKNLIKKKVDIYLSGLAITISVMLLLSKNPNILDIAHFFYNTVYLVSVSFLSNNKYLLGLNILMLLTTILSRHYYKGCVLNNKQKNTGFFYSLNDSKKRHLWFWNWDYIYPLLLIVSAVRITK